MDRQYLCLLAEIVDDSLSDDNKDPYNNWWDDDCLEIFIDQDRSMAPGDHILKRSLRSKTISFV